MNRNITIKKKEISLKTLCSIIKGVINKEDIEDSLKFTSFFILNQFDLFQRKEISIMQQKNFLKKIKDCNFASISIENLEIFNKIIDNCNNILGSIDELKNKFDKTLQLLDLIRLINTKYSLENELYYANIIEHDSAKSVNTTRMSLINNEIEDLTKKLKIIEPDYLYLKGRVEKVKAEFDNSNNKVIQYNKDYMNKTREINNISREIDSVLETISVYNDKIDDIKKSINNDEEIKNNEDYLRVNTKKMDLERKIEQLKNTKQTLTIANNQIRSLISYNKTELDKLKKSLSEIEPKFIKVNESYQEINSQLNIKIKELEELKSSLINDIIKQEPPTIDILRQKKPEMIRYSNIIKQEIQDTNIIIQRLNDSLGFNLDPIVDIEKIINLLRQNLKDIKTLFDLNSIERVNINDLISPLRFFNKEMPIIEQYINDLLFHIDLKVKIDNSMIRIINENGNNKKIKYGQEIALLNSKTNKEINYEDIPNYKKLFIIICFEIALSQYVKMDKVLFFEADMEPSLYTKANLIKIINLLNEIVVKSKILQDIRIIFINSKLNIKEEEIEGVKLYNFNDEII